MKSSVKDYFKMYGILLLSVIALGVAVELNNERAEYEESKHKYVLYDTIQIGDDKEPAEFEVYRNLEDDEFEFVEVSE